MVAEGTATEAGGVAEIAEKTAVLESLRRENDEESAGFTTAVSTAALAGFLLFADKLGGGVSLFSLFGAAAGAFAMTAYGIKEEA